ncbi:MAG: peptidoglycan DD-metalloendopeptidase family protein [Nodosilinea sp.]
MVGLNSRQLHFYWMAMGLALALSSLLPGQALATTQMAAASQSACQVPALSRLTRYRVVASDTLAAIADRYGLIAATLIGFNPTLQSTSLRIGQELVIPPYNGIRIRVNPGQTWQQLAKIYGTQADVLFEVNGCVTTVPANIFVPGVNWYPEMNSGSAITANQSLLEGYPLIERAAVVMAYGWQPDAAQNRMVFHTGVGLTSRGGAPVLAVGAGTVAFAGVDPVYGHLVVVNHAQGLQTRYANLDSINVKVGQRLRQGDRLARVAPPQADQPTFLYFEVRLNSAQGWVAQNPRDFVPAIGDP